MDADTLLSLFLATLLVEIVAELVMKTPAFITGPFLRLWKETTHLHKILHDERFARWKPEAARYVALRAIKSQGVKQETPQPVLDLLEASLKDGAAVVLLGEPGAGKTTALEALAYCLARRAYRLDFLLWFGLLFIAALPLFAAPMLTLLWLVSFLLWESLARRTTVPLFLEARSDYAGGDVKDWLEKILKGHLRGNPLLGSYARATVMVDGVNEAQASLYGTFVEGWRARLKKQESIRVIFTSRAGEDPAPRLEVNGALTVCDLDDAGVREFLQVYGREKASAEKKPYSVAQAEPDFEELRNKNLLGEKGIGRNPYWLKMIVEIGLYTPNRGVLFRNFAEKLIRREIEEKPEERKRKPNWRTVPPEMEMDALANLALAMHKEQRIGYGDAEGWGKARSAIRASLGDSQFTPDDVLGEAEAATLLRVRFKERVEFVHQLVQEFFAAYALRSERMWRDALVHAKDVWWWETLFLLGGLVGADGTDAYRELVEQTLGDGSSNQCLFAAIGLLRSVENPPADVSNVVIARFAASVGETLTAEQQHAAQELGRILGDEAAEAFGVLFHNPDSHIKAKGMALLSVLRSKRAAEILLSGLRDSTDKILDILVSFGAPAVEPLLAALRDPNVDVHRRSRAAESLVKIGAPAVEPLLAALRGRDIFVREHAASALGKMGAPAVEPLLAELRDPYTNVRWRAAYALGQIGAPVVEPLLAALRDHDAKVRWHSADALGQIGDARAFEPLLAALRDPDWRVRRGAANALRKIGDARAVEPLLAALRDPDSNVRYSAADALGKIGDARALPELERVAREDKGKTVSDENVADAAREAAEKIRQRMANE